MQRGKEVEQYDDEKKVALLAQKACGQDRRFSSDCRDNAPHCAGSDCDCYERQVPTGVKPPPDHGPDLKASL